MLDLLDPVLEDHGYNAVRLDGHMSSAQQHEAIRLFKEDEDVRIFLISLKAGGVGLNLTRANHVFVMDIWWNPAIEQQAFDRVYRVGQTKPVSIHRLIIKNSIEERILALQDHKASLAAGALQAGLGQGSGSGNAKGLSMSELLQLFKPQEEEVYNPIPLISNTLSHLKEHKIENTTMCMIQWITFDNSIVFGAPAIIIHNTRNKCEANKPNQTKPNQTKPNQ